MDRIILFTFLILFPFGQIIRIGIIHPLDIVVSFGALYVIYKKLPRPEVFKYFKSFIVIASFSWIFSIFIFKQIEVLYGLLYLVRLVNYFYFFVLVWNFAKQKTNQTLLTNSLLSLSLISALFGWIQYFTFPDLKPFFTFGWDEHLFRLAGTFLDPTFLGLLTVFGILISIFKKKWLFAVFLIISLAFTYSRASYLALFGGLFAIGFSQKKLKYVLLLVLSFGVLLTFLPLRGNVVLNISRSFSAIARVENYQETLKIFQTSPLFGIGFNNMCLARQKFIGPSSFLSHSCSGSDSSLLLILATTGIVGLISFLYLSIKVWKSSDNLFKVLAVSLTIHSIFSNSLFYSWIMSYVLIIFAVSLRGKVNN